MIPLTAARCWWLVVAFAALLSGCTTGRQNKPDPANSDPLQPDASAPATMVELAIPSFGERMNGLLYLANGEGPHPTVVLLHGFPGNERNLDLAQAFRRAGMNVLYFNYRGSWGSGGIFSFGHSLEDVASATAFLRQAGEAGKYRIDAGKIFLVGHSLGGWLALQGSIVDPAIRCTVALDFWNIGRTGRDIARDTILAGGFVAYQDEISAPGAPLKIGGKNALLYELVADFERFDVDRGVASVRKRPVLLVSTTSNDDHRSFLNASTSAGATSVTGITWDTDHLFSSRRIELAKTLAGWLERECLK